MDKIYSDGFDDEISKWQKVVDTLYEGGMTDDPEVLMACTWFVETNGDTELLEKLLEENPDILAKARRNMMVDAKAKQKNPFHPLPSGDELKKIEGEIILGDVNSIGNTVGFNPVHFTRGLFVCGEPGSGKSYPILRMLDQILSIPIEERGYNVLVFQAAKRDADFMIRKHEKFRVIEWKDFRYAPLEVESWDNIESKIDSFCDVYSAVNWLMLHGQPLLKSDIEICFQKYGQNNITFKELHREIDNAAKSIGLQGTNQRNTLDNLKFSLFSFMNTKEILNQKRGFNVSDFFTKEDIALNFKGQSSSYIVATVLGNILKDTQRYYETDPVSGKLRTLIIVDECRRVFPPNKGHSESGHNPNSPMINFVTSRRSTGIGLIAITQEPESSPKWLKDNSAYVLAMPISGESRKDVKNLLNLDNDQADYIDNLPTFGTGIMRYRGFDRRFIVDIPDDLDDKPIEPGLVQEMMQEYIDELHLKFSDVPREEINVDKENEKEKAPVVFNANREKKIAINKLNSIFVIENLVKNPFIHYTALRDEVLKITPAKMRDCIKLLFTEGLARDIECIGIRGRKARFIALTDKIPNRAVGAAHFRHTLYQNHIVEWLKVNGMEGHIEYSRSGCRGNIDVYASIAGEKGNRDIAYEVTLTMNKNEILGNIIKCLDSNNFQVDELCIVCEDEKDSDKVLDMVSESEILGSEYEKITYMKIKDFALV